VEEPEKVFLTTRDMATANIKLLRNLKEKKNADLLLPLVGASLLNHKEHWLLDV